MLNQLLETIIQILTGWVDKFTSHAQHVEDKLDSLDQTASDIETNTEPISDIKDNTGAVVTPIQNIKTYTDSIKQSSQTSANNTTAILNNVSTLSTNTGRAAAYAQDCANNTLDIKDKVTTIASDTTQLRADTSELNSMSDKIYEAIKWSLADKYIDETESGPSPMSFDTDIADDLKSLIIGIEAQQSGTGDPSPSNVRPISGFSDVDITINGNSMQISLGQTVFCGYLDVISGSLVITGVESDMGSLSWTYYTSGTNPVFQCNVSTIKINNSYTKPELLSDSYKIIESVERIPFTQNAANYDMTLQINATRLLVRNDTYTDVTSFKTAMTGSKIVYRLATAVEVQLTAQQIAAIKGVNTITSDTNGDIEVTYKESIKHYLDKQDN